MTNLNSSLCFHRGARPDHDYRHLAVRVRPIAPAVVQGEYPFVLGIPRLSVAKTSTLTALDHDSKPEFELQELGYPF